MENSKILVINSQELIYATVEVEVLSHVALGGALECLLFVAGEPLTIAEMARATVQDEISVERELRELQVVLTERKSGIQLVQIAGGWQLATRPEHSDAVARLMARASSKLTRAGMETLAIIAYRQPITLPEIEAVRGVSAAGVAKTLLDRRLITEAGKKATAGRPTLYATTQDFLHYFGLKDLAHLPEIDLEAPAPVSAVEVTDGKPEAEIFENSTTGVLS